MYCAYISPKLSAFRTVTNFGLKLVDLKKNTIFDRLSQVMLHLKFHIHMTRTTSTILYCIN